MEPQPAPTPDSLPAPVAPSERILALDVVRGLAVLGILVMNVVEFGVPMRAYDNPAYAGGSTGADLWAWYAQIALFDGKMRALFSMLFGAGMVLITERMVRKGLGGTAADLLLRRCLWLVPFGFAHRFVLNWTGDILYMYGLLGLIAVPFRLLRGWALIVLGLLALSAFVPRGLLTYAAAVPQRAAAEQVERMTEAGEVVPDDVRASAARWERRLASIPPPKAALDSEIDAIRGSWLDVSRYRWQHNHSFQHAYIYYYFVWDVLGMMLIGMALAKVGFFAGRLRRRTYVATIIVGAAAAIASFLWARAWAAADLSPGALEIRLAYDAGYPFARGLVGLAWASALILLVRAGALRAVTGALAAVGRLAFSNYVLQTVCCTLLFFGYGLGWYGDLSRAQLMLVVVGVSLVQVVFSMLWLRAFRFGPLEWAWRSLTYWHRQPFRRAT